MSKRIYSLARFFVMAMVLCGGAAVGAERIVPLEGQEITGDVLAIDEAGLISGMNIPAGVMLDGLRKIDGPNKAASTEKPAQVLELVGGGRIHCRGLLVANEKFTTKWALGEDLVLPIDVVRAVRFRPAGVDDGFTAALTKPSAETDCLFVDIDGKPSMLAGLVESIAADKVVFQYDGAQKSLPLERLFGIVFAMPGGPPKTSGGVTVELSDGSRLTGAVKSLANGKLNMTVGKATAVTVPWTDVQQVAVRSTRVAFLSDLEPIRVQEERIVTLPAPWQRDRNVQRGSLMIGERKFDRGIGTHAQSELVFDVGGTYDSFAATIGIDAAADRKGDCVFVVLGDGKELLRERKKGADAAQEIKVDITGVKQLSLVVEPGEDLDLADLADWGDARALRQK